MNKVLNIIFLPFKLILSFFMYVSLGVYYSVYGLFYPFVLIYNLISNAIFDIYKSKEKQKDIEELKQVVNMNINIDEKMKENERIEKEQEKIIRKQREKELKKLSEHHEKEKEVLLKTLEEQENVRSDKPITYKYKAKGPDGKIVTGVFGAFSKIEVYNYLEGEGYNVFNIDTNKYIELMYGNQQFLTTKMSIKDIIFWLTQLSTYLKSGIPLTDAMKILSKQMGKKDINKRRIFDSIIYNLTLGESFSECLQKQNNTFPPLLINMIKAAEATGELEETLDDMANYYSETEKTRKEMISALMYPSAIFIIAVVVTAFMLMFIVPKFEGIYASAGVEINPLTAFVLAASEFLKNNIYIILLIFVLLIFIIMMLYKNVKAFRHKFQIFMMKLPVFGNIIIYKELTIFTKTFASLLRNNVFITDSMDILSKITNNEIYKQIMINTIANIARGDKISESFKDHWAIPDVAYFMIVTGESTGELAPMMSKVSNYYQDEHRNKIATMKSFIEPAIIVILTVVVGGVILAVIIPMFSLYGEIQ